MKKLLMPLFFIVYACSTSTITVDLTSEVIEKGIDVFFEERDMDLARQSMKSNLKLLEVFNRAGEDNKKMLSILSKTYAGYTYVFLEKDLLFENNKNKKIPIINKIIDYYSRGKNFGLRALYQENKDIEKSIKKNNLKLLEQSLKKIKNKEALLWTAFNWGMLINQDKTSIDNIADIPKVKLIIDRLVKLDRNYFQATGLAIKAALECITPKMLGGKSDLGIKLLEEGLNYTERNFLIFQQIYLEYCIPQTQDKHKFKMLVKEINDKDININKNFILINKSVKEKTPKIKTKVQDLLID